jgi:hypothetical protein
MGTREAHALREEEAHVEHKLLEIFEGVMCLKAGEHYF